MKPHTQTSRLAVATASAICLLSFIQTLQAQTAIPPTFVLPSSAADTSQPGFVWRVHQVASGQPNDNARTEKQLAGLLGDNIADPAAQGAAIAPASPASPSTAPIRFDLAGVLNLNVSGFSYEGNFVPDDAFPGLPGTTGSTENVAAEILTWLDLPAGTITMGVNSDDGFRMTVGGATPIDKFAAVAGSFNGTRGASDTLFTITVAKAGLHAVRCTWEQGCCGANVELFTVKPDGSRVLVNDTANGGIPAYRAVTTPARAYARKVSPTPNSTSASALAPILVELVDGASPINPATTALSLDGANVSVTRSKAGGVTTLTYAPAAYYATGSQHSVVFSYKEKNALVQVPWTFTVVNDIGPNGHLYEAVLVENGITWPDAKTAAESRAMGGAVSHLATITSYEEDLFLERLRQSSKPDREDSELWVGGYQQKDSPDYWEPNGGWVWLNNEGPIPWYNWGYPYYTYANWQNWPWSQPDNAWGGEDYLAIGLADSFGWNDDGVNAGGRFDGTLGGYIVEYEPITLLVDIKPGDSTNAVNLRSRGKLPVAILSKPGFDATQLDPSLIRFGRTGTETAPVSWVKLDVNKDGRKDFVLQFEIQDTELICDDTGAVLTARTSSRMPAEGRDSIKVTDCPHYSLTATAMQDVNKVTDLELSVRSLKNGIAMPTVANHVLISSRDAVYRLRWIKYFQNVPLQQLAPDYSLGNLQVGDALPHQRIKVRILVPDAIAPRDTEFAYGETVVLLRPDLAVENVVVPANAEPCQVVNIMATIRELNGDLGASAYAQLYDGDQVIDNAWLWVGPRGSADVVFSRVFEQGGMHTLKVIVGEVAPGDYDTANNTSAPASIEIGQRTFPPVSYSTSYDRQTFEYHYEYGNPYYSNLEHRSGTTESLSAGFFLTPNLKFPFQDVTIQLSADGVQRENFQLGPVEADSVYGDGDYYQGNAYRQLGDGVDLYLYSYGACSGGVQAQLYRSAADVIYHSEYHDFYWGTTNTYDSVSQYGSFLNAASSLEIRFVLKHAAGTFGGTTGSIPVYSSPFNEQSDYEDPDPNYGYFYHYYNRGEAFNGYGSGTLTP